MNVVFVKMIGGLGNQMFRYAAAKALALRTNSAIKLDISFYDQFYKQPNGDDKREYELEIFSNFNICTKEEIDKLKFYDNNIIFKLYNKVHSLVKRKYVYAYCFEKKYLEFDPEILYTNSYLYCVDGDRQNEKYFSNFEKQIREDFVFKHIKHDEINYKLGSKMQQENSVAIHVRLGDYINHVSHSMLSLSYYEKALEMIKSKISNPVYYVFSDDVNWVKNNLSIDDKNVMYIDWNKGKDSYKDMYLMSKCKHNIIANSSFSWWGAWLNNNKDKIVIAPANWLPKLSIHASQIVPSSWLLIQ